MPISGLVVTFESPVDHHWATVQRLRETVEIEVGNAGGSKLAIVVDSENKRRDQEIWNMVRDLPGVIDLAVALVAFDEETDDNDGQTSQPLRN